MWRNVIGHGIYQIIVLMVILFQGANIFGLDVGVGDTPFFVT
jgi:hypothetical protein